MNKKYALFLTGSVMITAAALHLSYAIGKAVSQPTQPDCSICETNLHIARRNSRELAKVAYWMGVRDMEMFFSTNDLGALERWQVSRSNHFSSIDQQTQ